MTFQNELATLDFNETPFIGTAVKELFLSPDQVTPPIPSQLLTELETSETAAKRRLVTRVLEKVGLDGNDEPVTDMPLTWDEAVAIIQIQERARQGRLRFQLMKQIRSKGSKNEVQGRGLSRTKPLMTPHQAAVKLQSVWRSFSARRTMQRLRHDELVFLGMVFMYMH